MTASQRPGDADALAAIFTAVAEERAAMADGWEQPNDPVAPGRPAGQTVDRISIRKLGGHTFLSVDEWFGVSRADQAQFIRDGRVSFLCEGRIVPTREALTFLQQLRQGSALSA